MHANESVLREWVAAGDADRLEDFDRYLHADVVVHAPLGLSTRSIEDEKATWRRALGSFPDLRHDLQEVLCTASTIAARLVVTGTHAGEDFVGIESSGRRFEIDQALFAHVVDGKIAELWEIVDGASFRQQLAPLHEPTGSSG